MAKVLMEPQLMAIAHLSISSITKLDEIYSAEVFIHGIPWKVEVSKNEVENSLAVFLHYVKEDDSSNWAVPACATITLLPFSDVKSALVRHISPCVYSETHYSYGESAVIQWDDLLNDENKYVENDTIKLKIEITAEDPNYVDKSILKFESIDKSCDCGSLATFRITVKNVENLMAVRSSPFVVRGSYYDMTVYKSQKAILGIMLESTVAIDDLSDDDDDDDYDDDYDDEYDGDEDDGDDNDNDVPDVSIQEVSFKVKMSVKLMSFKNDVNPIKKTAVDQISNNSGMVDIENLITWDELLKPENGFVDNSSITLEVKIKADKPEGEAANTDSSCYMGKRRKFECSICLDSLDNKNISATQCGHIFCTACIIKAVKTRSVCPLCKETVQLKDLRQLY